MRGGLWRIVVLVGGSLSKLFGHLAIHYCDGYIDHRFQKPLPSAPLAVYSLLTHAILPISFGDGHSTVRYEHQAGTVSVVSFVIDSLIGLVAHSYGC